MRRYIVLSAIVILSIINVKSQVYYISGKDIQTKPYNITQPPANFDQESINSIKNELKKRDIKVKLGNQEIPVDFYVLVTDPVYYFSNLSDQELVKKANSSAESMFKNCTVLKSRTEIILFCTPVYKIKVYKGKAEKSPSSAINYFAVRGAKEVFSYTSLITDALAALEKEQTKINLESVKLLVQDKLKFIFNDTYSSKDPFENAVTNYINFFKENYAAENIITDHKKTGNYIFTEEENTETTAFIRSTLANPFYIISKDINMSLNIKGKDRTKEFYNRVYNGIKDILKTDKVDALILPYYSYRDENQTLNYSTVHNFYTRNTEDKPLLIEGKTLVSKNGQPEFDKTFIINCISNFTDRVEGYEYITGVNNLIKNNKNSSKPGYFVMNNDMDVSSISSLTMSINNGQTLPTISFRGKKFYTVYIKKDDKTFSGKASGFNTPKSIASHIFERSIKNFDEENEKNTFFFVHIPAGFQYADKNIQNKDTFECFVAYELTGYYREIKKGYYRVRAGKDIYEQTLNLAFIVSGMLDPILPVPSPEEPFSSEQFIKDVQNFAIFFNNLPKSKNKHIFIQKMNSKEEDLNDLYSSTDREIFEEKMMMYENYNEGRKFYIISAQVKQRLPQDLLKEFAKQVFDNLDIPDKEKSAVVILPYYVYPNGETDRYYTYCAGSSIKILENYGDQNITPFVSLNKLDKKYPLNVFANIFKHCIAYIYYLKVTGELSYQEMKIPVDIPGHPATVIMQLFCEEALIKDECVKKLWKQLKDSCDNEYLKYLREREKLYNELSKVPGELKMPPQNELFTEHPRSIEEILMNPAYAKHYAHFTDSLSKHVLSTNSHPFVLDFTKAWFDLYKKIPRESQIVVYHEQFVKEFIYHSDLLPILVRDWIGEDAYVDKDVAFFFVPDPQQFLYLTLDVLEFATMAFPEITATYILIKVVIEITAYQDYGRAIFEVIIPVGLGAIGKTAELLGDMQYGMLKKAFNCEIIPQILNKSNIGVKKISNELVSLSMEGEEFFLVKAIKTGAKEAYQFELVRTSKVARDVVQKLGINAADEYAAMTKLGLNQHILLECISNINDNPNFVRTILNSNEDGIKSLANVMNYSSEAGRRMFELCSAKPDIIRNFFLMDGLARDAFNNDFAIKGFAEAIFANPEILPNAYNLFYRDFKYFPKIQYLDDIMGAYNKMLLEGLSHQQITEYMSSTIYKVKFKEPFVKRLSTTDFRLAVEIDDCLKNKFPQFISDDILQQERKGYTLSFGENKNYLISQGTTINSYEIANSYKETIIKPQITSAWDKISIVDYEGGDLIIYLVENTDKDGNKVVTPLVNLVRSESDNLLVDLNISKTLNSKIIDGVPSGDIYESILSVIDGKTVHVRIEKDLDNTFYNRYIKYFYDHPSASEIDAIKSEDFYSYFEGSGYSKVKLVSNDNVLEFELAKEGAENILELTLADIKSIEAIFNRTYKELTNSGFTFKRVTDGIEFLSDDKLLGKIVNSGDINSIQVNKDNLKGLFEGEKEIISLKSKLYGPFDSDVSDYVQLIKNKEGKIFFCLKEYDDIIFPAERRTWEFLTVKRFFNKTEENLLSTARFEGNLLFSTKPWNDRLFGCGLSHTVEGSDVITFTVDIQRLIDRNPGVQSHGIASEIMKYATTIENYDGLISKKPKFIRDILVNDDNSTVNRHIRDLITAGRTLKEIAQECSYSRTISKSGYKIIDILETIPGENPEYRVISMLNEGELISGDNVFNQIRDGRLAQLSAEQRDMYNLLSQNGATFTIDEILFKKSYIKLERVSAASETYNWKAIDNLSLKADIDNAFKRKRPDLLARRLSNCSSETQIRKALAFDNALKKLDDAKIDQLLTFERNGGDLILLDNGRIGISKSGNKIPADKLKAMDPGYRTADELEQYGRTNPALYEVFVDDKGDLVHSTGKLVFEYDQTLGYTLTGDNILYIFPNPLRHSYVVRGGDVAVAGLMHKRGENFSIDVLSGHYKPESYRKIYLKDELSRRNAAIAATLYAPWGEYEFVEMFFGQKGIDFGLVNYSKLYDNELWIYRNAVNNKEGNLVIAKIKNPFNDPQFEVDNNFIVNNPTGDFLDISEKIIGTNGDDLTGKLKIYQNKTTGSIFIGPAFDEFAGLSALQREICTELKLKKSLSSSVNEMLFDDCSLKLTKGTDATYSWQLNDVALANLLGENKSSFIDILNSDNKEFIKEIIKKPSKANGWTALANKIGSRKDLQLYLNNYKVLNALDASKNQGLLIKRIYNSQSDQLERILAVEDVLNKMPDNTRLFFNSIEQATIELDYIDGRLNLKYVDDFFTVEGNYATLEINKQFPVEPGSEITWKYLQYFEAVNNNNPDETLATYVVVVSDKERYSVSDIFFNRNEDVPGLGNNRVVRSTLFVPPRIRKQDISYNAMRNFFDRHADEIDFFRASWNQAGEALSTNYSEFLKNYSLGEPLAKANLAAFKTPTGKIMKKLGYTGTPRFLTLNERHIEVLFRRPGIDNYTDISFSKLLENIDVNIANFTESGLENFRSTAIKVFGNNGNSLIDENLIFYTSDGLQLFNPKLKKFVLTVKEEGETYKIIPDLTELHEYSENDELFDFGNDIIIEGQQKGFFKWSLDEDGCPLISPALKSTILEELSETQKLAYKELEKIEEQIITKENEIIFTKCNLKLTRKSGKIQWEPIGEEVSQENMEVFLNCLNSNLDFLKEMAGGSGFREYWNSLATELGNTKQALLSNIDVLNYYMKSMDSKLFVQRLKELNNLDFLKNLLEIESNFNVTGITSIEKAFGKNIMSLINDGIAFKMLYGNQNSVWFKRGNPMIQILNAKEELISVLSDNIIYVNPRFIKSKNLVNYSEYTLSQDQSVCLSLNNFVPMREAKSVNGHIKLIKTNDGDLYFRNVDGVEYPASNQNLGYESIIVYKLEGDKVYGVIIPKEATQNLDYVAGVVNHDGVLYSYFDIPEEFKASIAITYVYDYAIDNLPHNFINEHWPLVGNLGSTYNAFMNLLKTNLYDVNKTVNGCFFSIYLKSHYKDQYYPVIAILNIEEQTGINIFFAKTSYKITQSDEIFDDIVNRINYAIERYYYQTGITADENLAEELFKQEEFLQNIIELLENKSANITCEIDGVVINDLFKLKQDAKTYKYSLEFKEEKIEDLSTYEKRLALNTAIQKDYRLVEYYLNHPDALDDIKLLLNYLPTVKGRENLLEDVSILDAIRNSTNKDELIRKLVAGAGFSDLMNSLPENTQSFFNCLSKSGFDLRITNNKLTIDGYEVVAQDYSKLQTFTYEPLEKSSLVQWNTMESIEAVNTTDPSSIICINVVVQNNNRTYVSKFFINKRSSGSEPRIVANGMLDAPVEMQAQEITSNSLKRLFERHPEITNYRTDWINGTSAFSEFKNFYNVNEPEVKLRAVLAAFKTDEGKALIKNGFSGFPEILSLTSGEARMLFKKFNSSSYEELAFAKLLQYSEINVTKLTYSGYNELKDISKLLFGANGNILIDKKLMFYTSDGVIQIFNPKLNKFILSIEKEGSTYKIIPNGQLPTQQPGESLIFEINKDIAIEGQTNGSFNLLLDLDNCPVIINKSSLSNQFKGYNSLNETQKIIYDNLIAFDKNISFYDEEVFFADCNLKLVKISSGKYEWRIKQDFNLISDANKNLFNTAINTANGSDLLLEIAKDPNKAVAWNILANNIGTDNSKTWLLNSISVLEALTKSKSREALAIRIIRCSSSEEIIVAVKIDEALAKLSDSQIQNFITYEINGGSLALLDDGTVAYSKSGKIFTDDKLIQMDEQFSQEAELGYYANVNPAEYEVFFNKDFELVYKSGKYVFSSLGQKNNFVLAKDNTLYIFPTSIHHSYVVKGMPVASAGEIVGKNGEISLIYLNSGHYKPSPYTKIYVVQELESRGMKIGLLGKKDIGIAEFMYLFFGQRAEDFQLKRFSILLGDETFIYKEILGTENKTLLLKIKNIYESPYFEVENSIIENNPIGEYFEISERVVSTTGDDLTGKIGLYLDNTNSSLHIGSVK